MTHSDSGTIQQRILAAAVELFSKSGYSGTSTRDISRLAAVNEVTIYRYYERKRLLFLAALESELSKISVRAELTAQLAAAPDARTAMAHIFDIVSDSFRRQPAMLRLIQFSALELGEDLAVIFRKHLGGLLDLSVSYLQRWVDEGELRGDPRMIIVAFAATVVALDTYSPVLWNGEHCMAGKLGGSYLQVWENAIIPGPVTTA